MLQFCLKEFGQFEAGTCCAGNGDRRVPVNLEDLLHATTGDLKPFSRSPVPCDQHASLIFNRQDRRAMGHGRDKRPPALIGHKRR